MRIIGCDLHARQQTLAILDTATGGVEKTDSCANEEVCSLRVMSMRKNSCNGRQRQSGLSHRHRSL
jgi:hypothetical protein